MTPTESSRTHCRNGPPEPAGLKASTTILPDFNSNFLATMMFGAQTAKQFQDNGQEYQDSMKDNSYSGGKHKNQKLDKFQIEEDKVIEAYVWHWQEHTKNKRFQQGQEQDKQDSNLLKQTKTIRAEDHNYRHGSERTSNTSQQSSSVSRLAGV